MEYFNTFNLYQIMNSTLMDSLGNDLVFIIKEYSPHWNEAFWEVQSDESLYLK